MILGDRGVIASRAAARGIPFDIPEYADAPSARVSVLHTPVANPVTAGRLDAANGRHVLALLDRALAGCVSGEFAAMVTAPVQKSTINEAGIAFTGHTEYLAERTGTPRVVMLLVGGGLRVALATTHLALADVPRAITREALAETLRIMDRDLRERFRIANPRIFVAGLNPHAGESGYLGREEIEVITPVIDAMAREGLRVSGPYPADTVFTQRMIESCDAVLAMFHDQGHIAVKTWGFSGNCVIMMGPPYLHMSVAHGTAYDIVGTGKADPAMMLSAMRTCGVLAAGKGFSGIDN